ncbi:ATP-grasp domain-containing protein [Enterococcus sp. BWR-S5]|uniref:ATP-grasp domain-containing protein n=1 Tax=Enterococcus sp. BWR-S5 TaxID=2787714 RepID=UPI001920A1CD|nr:ATP-grasp domain-containing protein [Enterococcus sp. BWR-S5]MBL1227310.1 ATP-grasp domain-containing protein [Enterococcus sp. BWR-S5]
MTVYIREAAIPTETSINKYNALVGFYLRGEEIVRYQSVNEIKELRKEDIVVDYIKETLDILTLMGIETAFEDYPSELSAFYGRKIRTGFLGEIVNNPDNWGQFVKPLLADKAFTGRVVNGTRDLIGIGLPFDFPVWISEDVSFQAEWRVFVLNRKVLDVRPYKGDYHHLCYDASVVDEAVAAWQTSPCAYALDIGVTADGRTLVVEVNDGYALGNYGLMPISASQFLEARWQEMTAPYFEKHEVLLLKP